MWWLRVSNVRTQVKGLILTGILVIIGQLFYMHYVQAFLERDQRQYFEALTDTVKIQRQFSVRNHSESSDNFNVGTKDDNETNHREIDRAISSNASQSDNRLQTEHSRKKTESSESAIVLFQKKLTHSIYRVLAGKPRGGKGTLTIGIPSARRPNTNVIYLMYTLNSIIQATTEDEKARTTIVILLSDTNTTYITEISKMIYHTFRQYCDTGFINVVELSQEVYPDLDHVRKTFNDDKPRLKWRAKQNIDYAYLMYYCREMSKYYLQLEDDVIAAGGFIKDIDAMIARQTSAWFLLEFSYFGFIGKLFKTSDLVWISEFLLTNYDLAPGDLQLVVMREKHNQTKAIIAKTTLFQHIGKFSSLKNKLMPVIDIRFKEKDKTRLEVDEIPAGHYPPAKIKTSLEVYMNYTPSKAYDGNLSTFFWGKYPRKGDFLTLIFQTPQNLSRILVLSGHPITYHDRNFDGFLTAATIKVKGKKKKHKCDNFENIVGLVEGQVDTLATGSRIPHNIICLSIHFTKQSRQWAMIREIRLVR